MNYRGKEGGVRKKMQPHKLLVVLTIQFDYSFPKLLRCLPAGCSFRLTILFLVARLTRKSHGTSIAMDMKDADYSAHMI